MYNNSQSQDGCCLPRNGRHGSGRDRAAAGAEAGEDATDAMKNVTFVRENNVFFLSHARTAPSPWGAPAS